MGKDAACKFSKRQKMKDVQEFLIYSIDLQNFKILIDYYVKKNNLSEGQI